MTPLTFHIDRIAFAAPGLDDWDILSDALRHNHPWTDTQAWSPTPHCLSARSARRVTPAIRLALTVAEKIGEALDENAGWVFASSVGEGETLHVILEALRTPEMLIQPLRFQNAVHNAPSGQWSIAAGITGPMTSLAAFDDTAGAGFLKSGLQVAREARPAGLVIYDVPLPAPLDDKRPLGVQLAAGFALTVEPGPNTLARVDMSLCQEINTLPERIVSRSLSATGNPVAAVMPLLERLAEKKSGRVILGLHGGSSLCLDISAP
ncbi:MAG: hypothetical protein HOK98_03330 [Rhodospirillaceae bacterium]|jgi:hypothetical protein|nr:hypothetical protein [Rhodospirillaceae bacterium]